MGGGDSAGRAEYEAERNERVQRKLNWNIKNRWEQRQLDDIMLNIDVRSARYRDFSKMSRQTSLVNVQDFSSVDEIFYFMECMFTEGFDEKSISLALDVFLRDIA